jgi:hypothetical protein
VLYFDFTFSFLCAIASICAYLYHHHSPSPRHCSYAHSLFGSRFVVSSSSHTPLSSHTLTVIAFTKYFFRHTTYNFTCIMTFPHPPTHPHHHIHVYISTLSSCDQERQVKSCSSWSSATLLVCLLLHYCIYTCSFIIIISFPQACICTCVPIVVSILFVLFIVSLSLPPPLYPFHFSLESSPSDMNSLFHLWLVMSSFTRFAFYKPPRPDGVSYHLHFLP